LENIVGLLLLLLHTMHHSWTYAWVPCPHQRASHVSPDLASDNRLLVMRRPMTYLRRIRLPMVIVCNTLNFT
jgi:hypothetical protein